MTNERIQAIAEVLENDDLRKELLAMEPAAAAEELKKQGYDFTADELIEFGALVAEATATGELNADDLDSVAGGIIAPALAVAIIGVGLAGKIAYDIGKAASKKSW